jgi:hypothetical protein
MKSHNLFVFGFELLSFDGVVFCLINISILSSFFDY